MPFAIDHPPHLISYYLDNVITKLITCLCLQFQTTAPKSCYMRPPGGILAPGESLIATGKFILLDLPSTFFFGIFFIFLCFLLSVSVTAFLIGEMLKFEILDSDSLLWNWNMANSIQVCGTSGEQWKTTRSEEQGQIQDHESKSERRNGLRSRTGMSFIWIVQFD